MNIVRVFEFDDAVGPSDADDMVGDDVAAQRFNDDLKDAKAKFKMQGAKPQGKTQKHILGALDLLVVNARTFYDVGVLFSKSSKIAARPGGFDFSLVVLTVDS